MLPWFTKNFTEVDQTQFHNETDNEPDSDVHGEKQITNREPHSTWNGFANKANHA